MCGIVGFWEQSGGNSQKKLEATVKKMSAMITERGPDDSGVWANAKDGIAIAQQRLSIIDLSRAAHQPMLSKNERYVISYNGEIYNFKEIRESLKAKGVGFKSESDTEVLVEACDHWGVEKAVEKLIGMFAFALYDSKEKTLTLVRDRLGIKPLYYAKMGNAIFFASQTKALSKHSGFKREIDMENLGAFVRFGYVPSGQSIFKDTKQLLPGSIVRVQDNGAITEKRYWSIEESVKAPSELSYNEAKESLESLLTDAVEKRLVSDVPVGAFLSGGVDSSTIAALMQHVSNKPIKTFTVGFDEKQYDESAYAAKIAKHLKTDHVELNVKASDVLDFIPKVPEFYDEPFADSSQLPTMLISKLIKKHVTVVLSGDGGDEVFAGYNRYIMAKNLERMFIYMPHLVRQGVSGGIRALPPGMWNKVLASNADKLLSGDRLHKLAGILSLKKYASVYPYLTSVWMEKDIPVLGTKCRSPEEYYGKQVTSIEDMQIMDINTYLPDDILTKVDRASMAFSLEARVPLLDHRVVEFGMSLPLEYKLHNGVSKKILRDVLYKHVPKELIERPKMGFGIPVAEWLRGPLREWAEALLNEKSLAADGIFEHKAITKKWLEHQSGVRNWQYALWPILMFQAWKLHWKL